MKYGRLGVLEHARQRIRVKEMMLVLPSSPALPGASGSRTCNQFTERVFGNSFVNKQISETLAQLNLSGPNSCGHQWCPP